MKLIIRIMAILVLVTSAATTTACSEQKKQPEAAKANNVPDSINAAKKTLDESKQINQTLMDADAKQREIVEKAQQQ